MEFSRLEYWSALPFPSPGDLPDPGIEPGFPALQADSLPIGPLRGALNFIVGPSNVVLDAFHFALQKSPVVLSLVCVPENGPIWIK